MSNLMKQKSRRAAARNNFTAKPGALQEDEHRVKLIKLRTEWASHGWPNDPLK